ncbi:uncharacterized protein EI90DRAFT_3044961 [Cantharellus anzutake]|uniref:uncharacterized protein n=1 Tax=Cantharellus anzutake TaxID=1750568 RepID=UPI001903E425|nr:uncharacterized protein EI90DRAFT_3044961 [Cantharellus anzutake]KAF8336240.1 hypothetical protein EI90DRAFT_3044961 [Cantharellus anzutake]
MFLLMVDDYQVWTLYLGNIVDAAEAEGIKHLVWSTLDDTDKDNLHVYHFVSKAAGTGVIYLLHMNTVRRDS